jgi:hypothetical protein
MTDRYYNFGNSGYSQFFEDAVVHEKLWLGKGYWDGTEQHFDVAIDEVKIFDRPLSGAEVIKFYHEAELTSLPSFSTGKSNVRVKTYPNPVEESRSCKPLKIPACRHSTCFIFCGDLTFIFLPEFFGSGIAQFDNRFIKIVLIS